MGSDKKRNGVIAVALLNASFIFAKVSSLWNIPLWVQGRTAAIMRRFFVPAGSEAHPIFQLNDSGVYDVIVEAVLHSRSQAGAR